MGECTAVASANLGVLGCFSDESVEEDPVDDEREGDKFKAVGRLLSSCVAILV
jgi:hypothetical protein